jgi:hypothetical protein
MSGKNKKAAEACGTGMPHGGKPDAVVECPAKKRPKLKVKIVEKGKLSHVFAGANVSTTGQASLGPTPTSAKGFADFGTVDPGTYHAKATLSAEDQKKFVAPDTAGDVTLAEGDDRTITIEVEPINTVTPKIEVEYKVVLLEPNMAQHQEAIEIKIHADPTYIEISYTETNTAHPFQKGAKLECSPANVEVYLDEKCDVKDKLAGNLTKAQLNGGAKVKLYLKGITAGKFRVKLDLEDPADKFVKRDKNPAEEEMGVVKLELKVHQYNEGDVAALKVDPDTDPIATYHTNLKAKAIPDQKEMSDADKVKKGRFMHEQAKDYFGRAKLILKKLDAGQWPAGSESYDVVITATDTSGGVDLFDKEWNGTKQKAPWSTKVSKAQGADTVLWAEGAGATSKLLDVRLDVGIDRKPGGLAKTPKRNGDWARFTVVKIEEVKVHYPAVANTAVAWDEAEQQFYINLKADTAGRKVTIGAKLSQKFKDVSIHFMLAPDKSNMKKANWGVDLPSTWKWKDVPEALKHKDKSDRKDVIHLSAKTDANGYAQKELLLSRFGADKFVPAAYIDQDPHLAKYVDGHSDLQKKKPVFSDKSITVWRKFWYQVVKVEGMNPPALSGAEDKYTRVKATMKVCTELAVTRARVNGMNPKAIYARYMVIVNGGPADALVVSDSNKAQFFTGFSAEADKPIKVPILICDAQWDAGGNSAAVDAGEISTANFPRDIATDKLVLSPPLQGGNLLVSGNWTAAEWDPALNAGAGDWANVRQGALANGDLSVNSARSGLRRVTVSLPAGVGATTAATRIWIEGLVIQGADGPYLGEYSRSTKRILAVYDPTEPVDFQNTIAHELGHAFHQVAEAPPAGIPAHPNQYLSKGSHCNKHTDKCLMYQSGPIRGSLNRYCDVCHPYVLLEDMSRLA